MKKLLEEMEERLKYLESQDESPSKIYRINELSLCIVRVQQLILEDLNLLKALNQQNNPKN